MPQAGFWAVGGYAISFRKDGAWYADEERIRNSSIQLLFSRSLRRDDREGAPDLPRYTGWLLDVGVDRQPVTVEDTPLVVAGIDGDPDEGFFIRTNDGESGPLDCDSLRIGAGDVLYCSVNRGERGVLGARFLRPAYYRIARFVEWDEGRPLLRSRGRRFWLDRHRAPMRIVLLEPEIPQNTGSIARLAAATATPLDLVGPLGFSLEDRYLKRAGLDYWPWVDLTVHESWQAYRSSPQPGRLIGFSARATTPYIHCRFAAGDRLLFGKETSGLGPEVVEELGGDVFTIPMGSPHVRSLNLSNAVSIIVYEARRQLGLLG